MESTRFVSCPVGCIKGIAEMLSDAVCPDCHESSGLRDET